MDFIKIREEHLELILKWRTSEQVTRFMYTDIEYNLEKQFQWYETIKKQENSFYWLISYKGHLIGLLSINDIDWVHKHSTFGFYIGEPKFNIIGGRIHPYLYNYVFFELGLNKVYAEVLEGNTGMEKMHMHYGHRFVGTYKQHIFKYNKYHDVNVYELLKEDWLQSKKQFHHLIGNFEQ